MNVSAADTMEDADLDFHKGAYDTSKLIEAWDIKFARTSRLAFYIGRAEQYSGRTEAALKWYDAAANREPVFAWVFYERSEIHEKAGDKHKLATDVLDFIKTISSEKLEPQINSEHKKAILRKGHGVFQNDVSLARKIYSAALQIGIFDYLSLLRIIEGMLDIRLISQADEIATLLRKHFQLDAFGLMALSRLMQAKNQIEEAVQAVEKASEMLPQHIWLRSQSCVRLIELGDYTKAQKAVDLFATDPRLNIEDVTQRLPALSFRLASRQNNVSAALAVLQDIDLEWSSIEIWIYSEAVYLFARYGKAWTTQEEEVLRLLHDYLFQHLESSEAACLAVLHYYFAKGEWKQAHSLIQRVAHLPFYESRDMIARRFEVACHLQDMPEAQTIYATHWQNNPSLKVNELALLMRMRSELKDWQTAAELAAEIVERGMALPDDCYGILQIIRQASQHQRFVELIERTGRTDPFAVEFQELLVDDLCVTYGRVTLLPGSRQRGLSRRNSVLVKTSSERRHVSGRQAGFICSDRSYFISVLTLIASLASNINREADWYLFLSEDVPKSWVDNFLSFCACLNFEITVVSETEFLSFDEQQLNTEYGLFSGGRNLARSAYFRIYAADWLLRKGLYSRAVYMDSDIICQADIDDLFTIDLGSYPLAARPEECGPPVVKAAHQCGVAPENYINSGVLVFNFGHPKLADCLHAAIWQSENGGSRLTFHDQCALNIAFAGEIKHLSPEFNTFLRPFKTHENEMSAGVLLHYLDRPKPWDTGARYDHRSAWLMAATVVKAIVPGDWYREVVAAGIGQPAAPTVALPVPS